MSAGTRALRWLALACVPLLLVSVFTDGLTIHVGSRTFDYERLDVPLYVMTGIAVLWLLACRRSLIGVLRDMAAAEPSDRVLRIERSLVAALVALGFVLRIARVHEYGLSLDEAQFLWVASAESLWDVCRYVLGNSPHPPGHFVLLHLMLRVSRSLLWLRLPSILAGTFLIWASHRVARELFGRSAGIAMAILVTFSPALLDLSRACRNYVPGLAFLLVALWSLLLFLHHWRWRDFGVFATAEVAAVLWAYGFVVPIAAANVTLVAALVRRRAPLGWWIWATVIQLPLGLLVAALYLHHITKLPPMVVAFHESLYSGSLRLDPSDPFRPLFEVWKYLTLATTAPVLFWLGMAGAGALLVRREWLKLLFCTSPVLLGYAAMALHKLPLGNSRHSVYLFPYLFGLVASLVATIPAIFRARPTSDGTPGVSWTASVGALVAVALTAAYVDVCMLEYDRNAQYEPFTERQRELLTYYRQEDVDRAFALLRERATPRDVVMLTVQGMYAVRAHFGMAPILDPTSEQRHDRDLRWAFASPGPLRLTIDGVAFYMAPEGGFMFNPSTLAHAVRKTTAFFGLEQPRIVWTLRTGWERWLTPQFVRQYPRAPVDVDVDRETNGLLFAIDGATLERAVPR